MWGVYVGQQLAIPLSMLLPTKIGPAFAIAIPILIFLAIAARTWPKTDYLREEKVLNGNKATIGIFVLTLGLLAFPGTVVVPFAYAAWSSRPDYSMYAWYSLFGIPVFIVLSIAGLTLLASARPKKA